MDGNIYKIIPMQEYSQSFDPTTFRETPKKDDLNETRIPENGKHYHGIKCPLDGKEIYQCGICHRLRRVCPSNLNKNKNQTRIQIPQPPPQVRPVSQPVYRPVKRIIEEVIYCPEIHNILV